MRNIIILGFDVDTEKEKEDFVKMYKTYPSNICFKELVTKED